MQKIISAALFLMMAATPLSVLAKGGGKVTGTVLDESGEPVIGAIVHVPGKNVNTVTDINGNFSIAMPDGANKLTFTYLGYQKLTSSVKDNEKELVVHLTPDANQLNEVVAIGYGSVKRSNVTGSVSKIGSDVFEAAPTTNVAELLQGQMSGVEVTTSTGELGGNVKIRVRGASSINADTSPLYVVDGVVQDEIDEDNPIGISGLDPQNIESIEVLKDAASAAIYGSRASNGVVLITTKLPQKVQPTKVSVSASFSVSQIERKADIMSSSEWIGAASRQIDDYYVKKFASKGATVDDDFSTRWGYVGGFNAQYLKDPRWTNGGKGIPGLVMTDKKGNVYDFTNDLLMVDWQDEVYRLAPMETFNLGVSGANEQTKYNLSASYTNQDGIILNSNSKKLNVTARIETKFLKKFSVGANLSLSGGWLSGAGTLSGKSTMSNTVMKISPVVDSGLGGINQGAYPYPTYYWAGSAISPVAYLDQWERKRNTQSAKATAFLRYNIIKGFDAEIQGSYTASAMNIHEFVPGTVVSKWASKGTNEQTKATDRRTISNSYLLQGTLKYVRNFNKVHDIDLLAGVSTEYKKSDYSYITGTGFAGSDIESFRDTEVISSTLQYRDETPVKLLSGFLRGQYGYDDRYLLNVSARWDGSSRFARGHRFSFFPAVSAAWRIDQEHFYEGSQFSDIMNQLKIRLSWGQNGNNRIDNSASRSLLEEGSYSFGDVLAPGYVIANPENPYLTWEKTDSYNFAIDMGWFNNRIQLTAEYYIKNTRDLLYKRTVPAMSGFTSAWSNLGNIRNTGVELDFRAIPVSTKDFSWTTSFNAGYNKNEVTDLGGNDMVAVGRGNNGSQLLKVGQPLRVYYMYDAVGVYQTQEDLENYPKMKGNVVGDLRYRDVDKNGYIDENDKIYAGKPTPDWTFGWTNKFKYKNFDMSITCTGQVGGSMLSMLQNDMEKSANLKFYNYNNMSCWQDCWVSPENPGDGQTPSASGTASTNFSTRYLYSTDFFKIKNITIGYNLKFKQKNALMKNLRIYGSVQNVAMWDKYKAGFSPESNNGTWKEQADYDYGSQPLSRIYTIGVNATF